MSSLTWDQLLLEQHRARPLSSERLKAELLWQELTGGAPAGLPPLPAMWWAPPAAAPAPRSPRGRGRKKPATTHVVAVERKGAQRMLTMPDGREVAGSRRTVRTTITVAA
jgi:hypothetical protein